MPFIVPAPPSGSQIPTNGWIHLQSYNGVHGIVQTLAARQGRAWAHLVARGDTVPLRVTDFFDDNEGGYGAGALVLAPQRTLQRDRRYQLKIGWRVKRKRHSAVLWHWSTTTAKDHRPPRWLAPPHVHRSAGRQESIYLDLEPAPGVVRIVAKFRLTRSAPEGREEPELRPAGGARVRSPPARRGCGSRQTVPRRLMFIFDPTRICPTGPTVDYRVAVARSHCPEKGSERSCHTAHMYGTESSVGKRFRVTFLAADQAGNRRFAPGAVHWTWDRSMSLTVCLKAGPPAMQR